MMKITLHNHWRFLVAGILWILTLQQTGFSQVFEGRVVDNTGEAILYATIYIEETKGGCTTDESGFFSMQLDAGTYLIKVRHVSYATQIQAVTLPLQQPLIIQMTPKSITLSEAVIRVNKEDPAYNIMRRAISRSPYHRQQLISYRSSLYSKATLYIDKVPKVLNFLAKKAIDDEQFSVKAGDVYTRESVSELKYKDDSVQQKVISIKSSFPKEFEIQIDEFGMYNIYDRTGDFISPLSPKALSAYRFRMESTSQNDYGKTIYHIKVTPKNNNPYAFTGYVDIVDSSWHVHYFDLSATIDFTVGTVAFNIKEHFGELEKGVWMPISFYGNMGLEAMRAKARINLSASIQYNEYQLNKNIPAFKNEEEIVEPEEPVTSFVVSEKSKKIEEKIQQVSEKEELTNRDALKIVSLLNSKEKEDEKNNPQERGAQNTLEIKNRSFVTIDSMADKRDSLYWIEHRKLPLSVEEQQSYVKRQIADSIAQSKTNFLPKKNIIKDFTKRSVHYGFESFNEIVAFNTVDEWKFKLGGYLNKQFKDSTTLNNTLAVGYSLKQKHVLFNASSQYIYYPEKRASVKIFGGAETTDFNLESGVKPFVNTLSSLFFRENYINFYYRSHIGFEHVLEIVNGLDSWIGFTYEWRKQLQNESDYSFFYRDTKEYRPNIPENPYLADNQNYVEGENAALLNVTLSYTPQRHYYFNGRTKRRAYSDYPTLVFVWKKGIQGLFNSSTNFDYLQLGVRQTIDFGILSSLRYEVDGGWFPNRKKMHFSEFKQFQIYEFPLMFKSFQNMYHTMQTYTPATNEWMVSGFLKYETPYLMLKFLPGLNKTLMTESLYLSYLKTPFVKDYFELGYSLNNIWLMGRIGFFVGFDHFKYANWSWKVSITL